MQDLIGDAAPVSPEARRRRIRTLGSQICTPKQVLCKRRLAPFGGRIKRQCGASSSFVHRCRGWAGKEKASTTTLGKPYRGRKF
jgi:hypothetical protein